MTDNEKLAVWQGWKNDATLGWCRPIGKSGPWFAEVGVPDYLNDDAAAMSLLDTLVEKGGRWEMFGKEGYIQVVIKLHYNSYAEYAHTRRAAVVAAVLELIEKEDV